MTRHLLAVCLALVVAAGCNRKQNTPAPPPSPTLTSLAISPATDMVRAGATETLAAIGTFSDGSVQTVLATWSSSATGIATVDASGRVTGVSNGQTTITASAEGMQATRQMRVVPDYHGRWEGNWRIVACTETGEFAGICEEYPVGELFLVTLVATQTRDTIAGTLDFGDNAPGTITGIIASNGQLEIDTTYSTIIEGFSFEFTIQEWRTLTIDNQRMTGTFRILIRITGIDGSFTLSGEINEVTKTSPNPTRVDRGERGLGARALRR